MANNWGGARPGSGRKPSKEKRRPYSFRLTLAEHKRVKEFIQKMKEENKMRTWQRNGYTVEERAFDHDLHCFAVVQPGQEDQIIYPATIEDMQAIIADLDNGADVDGWEDGMGNVISVVTMSHEDMVSKAWAFIEEAGITEDKAAYQKDDTLILVDDVHKVRDAYYSDLESGVEIEDEDVYGFLDRHDIKWQ